MTSDVVLHLLTLLILTTLLLPASTMLSIVRCACIIRSPLWLALFLSTFAQHQTIRRNMALYRRKELWKLVRLSCLPVESGLVPVANVGFVPNFHSVTHGRHLLR